MKIIKTILICVFLSSMNAFASDTLPENFQKLLDRAKMTFEMPEGSESIEVIENNKLPYHFAIKNPDKEYEIRYIIKPMDVMLDKYKENLGKGKKDAANPNDWHRVLVEALAHMIKGEILSGTDIPFGMLDENENIQKAEWGAICLLKLNETTFSKGYQYCVIVAIHKDDCGNGYIFYMTNDKNISTKDEFFSLRFKE